MKKFLFCLFLAGMVCSASANKPEEVFDERYRLVFFAVLEGLYMDGVSAEDVDRILLANDKGAPYHFIYACPLCMPTWQAVKTYKTRPVIFGFKMPTYQEKEQTMGYGLEPELSGMLASGDQQTRLKAINTLVARWIRRKIDSMNLSNEEGERLRKLLEEGRDQGMNVLKRFARDGTLDQYAPGFEAEDECAVCNASVGKAMQMDLKGH